MFKTLALLALSVEQKEPGPLKLERKGAFTIHTSATFCNYLQQREMEIKSSTLEFPL